MNPWIYKGNPVVKLPDDCVGFVYLITNGLTGQKYVGKKLATVKKQASQKTTTTADGVKKVKRKYARVSSDWETYMGSSQALLDDVTSFGWQPFRREILYYCKTKSECNYLEAREQMDRRVLESRDYYNNQIMLRVHGSHVLGKIP